MGPYPFDEDELDAVLHPDDEPVLVPPDVEDDPSVAHQIGRTIEPLHIGWALPFGLFDLFEPSQEWLLGVLAVVPVPQLSELRPGDDLHWRQRTLFPSWEQAASLATSLLTPRVFDQEWPLWHVVGCVGPL